MGVLTTIMQDEDLEYSYGKTYVQSLVLWIPRAIWENRPLDAPRSFVRLHMKEWKPRHGLGYFPLAEAYQNFGVIGAFIQFLIFGVIWGAFWNLFRKLFANYLQIIIYVYLTQFMLFFGIYMLIMVRRGASNTLYFPSHLLSFQFGLFKK